MAAAAGNEAFYYGGMPTGIVTRPETYEDWEFTHPDRHDLAAMGRVWYLEAWARAGRATPRDCWTECAGLPRRAAGTATTGGNVIIPTTRRHGGAGRCREVLRVPGQPDPHRAPVSAGH